MREILTSQLNILVLLTFIFLVGNIRLVFFFLSGNTSDLPECTISTKMELKKGIIKTGVFRQGTDCDAMRSLAEEGKPLPTIKPIKPSP